MGTIDLSDHIAKIQVGMRELGLTWQHPRMVSWLERAGKGAGWSHLRDLPDAAVIALAGKLWAEVLARSDTGKGGANASFRHNPNSV